MLIQENAILKTENAELKLKLNKKEKKEIKPKNNKKFDHKKQFDKWKIYYNQANERAVDFNNEEIDTSKSKEYLKLIIEAKEKLQHIFNSLKEENLKYQKINSKESFKIILFNPNWQAKDENRGRLIEILKQLNLSKDEFINSELVTKYFTE